MPRPVTLLWAALLTAFTRFGQAAMPFAPPPMVASALAWAGQQTNRHRLAPCAAGKTPW